MEQLCDEINKIFLLVLSYKTNEEQDALRICNEKLQGIKLENN